MFSLLEELNLKWWFFLIFFYEVYDFRDEFYNYVFRVVNNVFVYIFSYVLKEIFVDFSCFWLIMIYVFYFIYC